MDEFPVKSHQINYYSLAMYTKKISKIFQKISGSPSGHLLACCVDLQIELVETQN